MVKQSLPQMTEAAYVAVREAFRRSVPAKATVSWIMANIPGYKSEASAKALLRYLTLFGILGEDGAVTDVGKAWRMDDGYADACEHLLRSGFPHDIVDAAPVGAPIDVLVNLFMTRGFGEGSARNLARIYRLIASRVPPDPKKPKGPEPRSARPAKKSRPERESLSVTPSRAPEASESSDREVVALRYFLERGRMAELRIPGDLDEREKKRLFAHLRIDLLDEVSE